MEETASTEKRRSWCLPCAVLTLLPPLLCVVASQVWINKDRVPGWLSKGKPLVAAIEAYREKHEGRPPADLSELVPEYLAEVPLPRTIPDCHTVRYAVYTSSGAKLSEQVLQTQVLPPEREKDVVGEPAAYTIEIRYMLMRDSVQSIRYDSRKKGDLPGGWGRW